MTGPITLTQQQFAKTKAAKTGGTYKRYLNYVAKRRASLLAQPHDPYDQLISQAPQPYTPGQIRQQTDQYVSQLPQPLTYQQIQDRATGQISPLVQAVTQRLNDAARSGADAIRGYTQSQVAEIGKIPFARPYQQAEQAQAATDSALHQALSGAGASDAADLQKRLAVINDPSVAQAASAVSDNGTANANTSLALGTDSMSNLIAQAAAAGNLGNRLPVVAQLSGIQQLGSLTRSTQDQLSQAVAQLEGQVPGLIQSLSAASDTNRSNRAQAGQQLFEYLTGVNTGRSKDLLSLKGNKLARQDAIGAATAKNNTTIAVAKAKAVGAAAVAQAKGAAVAAQDAKPNASLSKSVGYLVDSNGNPIPDASGNVRVLPGYTVQNGQVVKTGKTATGTGGKPMTATQVQSYISSVTTTKTRRVSDGNGGSTSSTSTTGHKINYGQAYKYLRDHGVADQDARIALDASYKRGVDGRAWLTNEEQAVLKSAAAGRGSGVGLKGVQAKDVLAVNLDPVSHHRFLSPAQYELLKAAGKLPPGAFQKTPLGQRWYIAQ